MVGVDITSKIDEFKETGDISILLELDKLPHKEFEHPSIKAKSYMWSTAHYSEHFTCFQTAMAHALDHFHPGIVAYIANEFPETYNTHEHFVAILNKIFGCITSYSFGYRRLTGRNSTSLNLENMFEAVTEIERRLKDGYLVVQDGFHGELYRFQKKDDQQRTILINNGEQPTTLWEKGKIRKWYSENEQRSVDSSSHFLENHILSQGEDLNIPKTRFFGRNELEKAFRRYDLRKIVQEQVKAYQPTQ